MVTHLLVRWNDPTAQFYSNHSTAACQPGALGSPGVSLLQVSYATPRESSVRRGGENSQLEAVKESRGISKESMASEVSQPLRDTTNLLEENGPASRESSQTFPSTLVSESTSPIVPTRGDCAGSNVPFTVQWKARSCSHDNSSGPLSPPLGRGAYVAKFSPTGNVLAFALNQKSASDSQVLFCSLLTDSGLSSLIYNSTNTTKSGR